MSSKASTQAGRRTPLSLSGTVTKGQPNKGVNAANSSGGNANGNSAANNNKQDNKQQLQQKTEQQSSVNQTSDIKDIPNKKHHAEKKHQQNDNKKTVAEKTQNGVNNKQQQQNKEKQNQNGNEGKLSEKDKKEKSDKPDKPEKQDKPDKQNKADKEELKPKEVKKDQEISETKKEDKKVKEVKENKIDVEHKTDEKQEKAKQAEETKSKDLTQNKIEDAKEEDKVETIEVQLEEQQQQQKSLPVTPKSNNRGSKNSTPSNKTPAKTSEKTPSKSVTPSKSGKTIHIVTREVTTAIDADVEMEPLAVEHSPIKSSQLGDLGNINIAPSATSTPGKIILPKLNIAAPKSDVQLAMITGISPERPKTFSHISGRKSIRPISDYTPMKFQSNSQFRESYRRINTELDVTNTSLNVTVGSEVPNNSSFSFFGRGRKRDRTPPQQSQSAIGEIQTDMEISPPKRARYDMQGFFNAVSSPLSLLRNRFSKATLQSSTPVKLEEKLNLAEDEIEVQNVSGVSIHEEINNTEKDSENTTVNSEDDATLGVEAEETQSKKEGINVAPENVELKLEDKEFQDLSLKIEKSCAMESEQSDIKITETPLQPALVDPMAKNKRCVVM